MKKKILRWLIIAAASLGGGTAAFAQGFPVRPDPTLTPGVVDASATRDKVCTPGYSKTVRNVTAATKAKVFADYKINPRATRFEIDHLISLELGGSNDPANLWPQAYTTPRYNATVKDGLENRLHWLVCHGQITLPFAQEAIRSDWIAAYRLYVQGPAK